MKLTGAEILIECLKEQGVDTIFGYPGGTVLDIYDALYKDGGIRHVLTSHEQGAAHAADGYARVTGKVGVCLATSGPGATNLVTGIAAAYMDSIPLVAITGNVTESLLGRDSFQEIDIAGITIPITKNNYIVKDVTKLADIIRRAFYIAQSGRKGPVLIDILKNVQTETAEYERVKPAAYRPAKVFGSLIYDAADMINAAKKPLIIAGGGVISCDAGKEVRKLAEKINAPLCHTLMGKGVLTHEHRCNLGMIGMHGTVASAKALLEADVVIALGTRFSDRVAMDRASFSKNKRTVQIEIDNAEIDKNVTADVSVLADVYEAVKELTLHLNPKDDEWLKKAYAAKEKDEARKKLFPEKIMYTASKVAPPDSVLVTDVGQHQMWAAKYFSVSGPRRFCTSGGLGAMGYGMGASLGAFLGSGKPVTLVTGDGCLRMNMNEFPTCVACGVPLVVILIDNGVLGMVRQLQKVFTEGRFSQTDLSTNIDFVAFAKSMGGEGLRLTKKGDAEAVLKKAYDIAETKRIPVLVDCIVDKDDNVLPMIKPGSPYSSQITKIKD
ncbi:MAG: biosynthetic-type acetolactate synthase large subunit [Clostridia bacterium]|nr:biosynthetic-type acetolactate synthase large subunit [Clostridia bacterium]